MSSASAANLVGDAAERLVVLSGPSGVGKSTVVKMLRTHHPEVWISVSATTRFPRPGEIDGVHYWFIGRAEFERRAAAGEFLEWAEFDDNLYGTPLAPVAARLALGESVLLEIDLQGARQVRERLPAARLVFLKPPSWGELVRRLTERHTEPPEVVERRLAAARRELAAEPEFDYALMNSDVPQVCQQLVALLRSPHQASEA
ncbi:MAG: guanylate kinase [Jiangellaceae bacterium]|nr:guanylate kinase [Jiangellaceae bacterium]